MRIPFLILVIVHGLIHLFGFVKAFELSEVKQLTQTISKPFSYRYLVRKLTPAFQYIVTITGIT